MTHPTPTRILTLWQPWASLMLPNELDGTPPKRIETRSWSTRYRGPVLIHAAVRRPPEGLRLGLERGVTFEEYLVNEMGDGSFRLLELCNEFPLALPLGVVVGVGDLVDVLPIGECSDGRAHLCRSGPSLLRHSPLEQPFPDGETELDVTRDLPFGDYTPGRFGWCFENVRALAEPVPWKGGQGLRHTPAELLDLVEAAA